MPSKVVSFERIKYTYPFSTEKKDKYLDYKADKRSYRADSGFPTPGYNPHHNLTKPQKVVLTTEEYTLLPY